MPYVDRTSDLRELHLINNYFTTKDWSVGACVCFRLPEINHMNNLLNSTEMSEQDLMRLEQRIKEIRAERTKAKKEVLGDLIQKLKSVPEDSPVHATIELLSHAIARLKQGKESKRGRKLDPATKAQVEIAVAAGVQSPAQIAQAHNISLSYVWVLKRKYEETKKREAAAASRRK